MQPVLSLIEDHRYRGFEDVGRDLFAAMRRQAVHEERAGSGRLHQRAVHLEGTKREPAGGRLLFLSHRRPDVGIDGVDTGHRLAGIPEYP